MKTKEPTKEPDAGQTTKIAATAPYIPWKTFNTFIAILKSTHAPDVIDSGVMPSTISGGLQRHLKASLKFLGLTDSSGKVLERFNELIAVHGTPQWPTAVKEYVLPAYESIIGDLPIQKASAAQLDAKFKGAGFATGQVLDKAVRFYLHALKAAEVKYSSYWSIRSEGTGGGRARKRAPAPRSKTKEAKTGDKPAESANGLHRNKETNNGLIEFPLHFGDKPTGMIGVPLDMNENDLIVFDAMVGAVKAYCARKKTGSK